MFQLGQPDVHRLTFGTNSLISFPSDSQHTYKQSTAKVSELLWNIHECRPYESVRRPKHCRETTWAFPARNGNWPPRWPFIDLSCSPCMNRVIYQCMKLIPCLEFSYCTREAWKGEKRQDWVCGRIWCLPVKLPQLFKVAEETRGQATVPKQWAECESQWQLINKNNSVSSVIPVIAFARSDAMKL